MSKYHYLIAGLPDITLDDSKQAFSVYSFKEEVYKLLSEGDKKLMDLFFLKYDNQNLLRWLQNPLETDATNLDDRGTISPAKFMSLVELPKEKIGKELPSYMVEFLKSYVAAHTGQQEKGGEDEAVVEETDDDDENAAPLPITWEDRLTALYYAYAIKKGNRFFASWFQLNLTIKNILTAITCRKHGLDKNLYIIGNDPVAISLRTSGAKDFNLGDDVEFLPELLKQAEEADLVLREKKIDLIKWEWLEDNTIFKVFDIESIFAYLLKTEMIERWTNLDKEGGEATFRELISSMKKDSNTALDEFKKKNNKK